MLVPCSPQRHNVASAGLSAKSEKATVSPSVMGYGADSTWMPVLRAVTFAAPHVGVRLLCFIWYQHLLRSRSSDLRNDVGAQNAAFVRRMEGRGVQVLRVVNRWDYVPHVPGASLEPLSRQLPGSVSFLTTLLACRQESCTYSRL